jgi:hypothetical protein
MPIYVYRRRGVPDFSGFGPLVHDELASGGNAVGASCALNAGTIHVLAAIGSPRERLKRFDRAAAFMAF